MNYFAPVVSSSAYANIAEYGTAEQLSLALAAGKTCGDQVDCNEIVCLSKCGVIESLENQSACSVIFELLVPGSSEWTAFAPAFPPGSRWILYQGAAYVPADTRVRAVRGDDGTTIVAELGSVGSGRKSFVIDASSCDADNGTLTSAAGVALAENSSAPTPAPQAPPAQKKMDTSLIVWLSVMGGVGVLAILIVIIYFAVNSARASSYTPRATLAWIREKVYPNSMM